MNEQQTRTICYCNTQSAEDLKEHLENTILREHGGRPMLHGDALSQVLGYPSVMAFKKAASRGLLPVPVFAIPRREGKFALVTDIAHWMVELREQTLRASSTASTQQNFSKLQKGGVWCSK
jgi:hypothetical protein